MWEGAHTRISRRRLLQYGAAAGAAIALPGRLVDRALAAASGSEILDPRTIEKYAMPLIVPPAMPRSARLRRKGRDVDYYRIAVRQFRQQILPPGMPETTVWSYGSPGHRGSFNYPAFTIEARHKRPVRVKWINGLVDRSGNYLPHLLPVDPTLHWANPPGGRDGRDTHPRFDTTPGPYRGPVPIVTHLHGGHSRQESDGFPEAWYLPAASDIPDGYARAGSQYREFKSIFEHHHEQGWKPGTAVFQYENDQPAATLWYHDHTLGMTRANVYAGPAGFYLVRGGERDLPRHVLPWGKHEIPLAIQDRSFRRDGSLFYPGSRKYFDGFPGPYIGSDSSDMPPIWNPEFFANAMVTNGRTWPLFEARRRRYRFRILNGCNSRFLILKLVVNPRARRPARAAIPFWQIGADGGFLPKPVQLSKLLIAPAERADVIVDFGDVPEGSALYLINEGPDEPFGGGVPNTDFPPADPRTTGQVMKIVVGPRLSSDETTPPERLELPAPKPLGPTVKTRRVSLNEEDSVVFEDVGPREADLGTLSKEEHEGIPKGWDEPITERPRRGRTEIWEIHNFTADAHPIHIHDVQFRVLDRRPFAGSPRPPERWEHGRKDTVIAYPSEITRVKVRFDHAGLFVWHCHILEHEDNEMMRPLRVKRS